MIGDRIIWEVCCDAAEARSKAAWLKRRGILSAKAVKDDGFWCLQYIGDLPREIEEKMWLRYNHAICEWIDGVPKFYGYWPKKRKEAMMKWHEAVKDIDIAPGQILIGPPEYMK